MNENQRREDAPPREALNISTRTGASDAKKIYEVPELVVLGDLAGLTNDASVIIL
ncbi:MAG: hypothetical protein Q8O15_00045 [Rectinemataceae bacterium]|nr:hypothetical protein [Rectinemataceae bacterium]